jgi:hypothetical protein
MVVIAREPKQEADPRLSLLRLYPAVWRARYGDEFAELLAARPPSLRDRLDILLGAIDARIHPQLGTSAAGDGSLPGDRAVRILILVAGGLLTLWSAIGFSQVGRWDSELATGQEALLAVAWTAGFVGSILLAIALLRIAARFDQSIGGSGAVGGVLTGAGLLFSALGGGILGLAMLGIGTLLLCVRLRGRMLGTVPTALLAGATAALISAMLLFVASGWQEPGILVAIVGYGPAWVVVGLRIHDPAPQLVHA